MSVSPMASAARPRIARLSARSALVVLSALFALAPASHAASTSLPTKWKTPNGWLLRPAGTQVLTQREPTGVSVAPDGSAIYTVSSGIFDEEAPQPPGT